jgi:hypothetical protein
VWDEAIAVGRMIIAMKAAAMMKSCMVSGFS